MIIRIFQWSVTIRVIWHKPLSLWISCILCGTRWTSPCTLPWTACPPSARTRQRSTWGTRGGTPWSRPPINRFQCKTVKGRSAYAVHDLVRAKTGTSSGRGADWTRSGRPRRCSSAAWLAGRPWRRSPAFARAKWSWERSLCGLRYIRSRSGSQLLDMLCRRRLLSWLACGSWCYWGRDCADPPASLEFASPALSNRARHRYSEVSLANPSYETLGRFMNADWEFEGAAIWIVSWFVFFGRLRFRGRTQIRSDRASAGVAREVCARSGWIPRDPKILLKMAFADH